ncbi:MAG: hypothetical protein RL235_714 [Chlamydiota bacterium]|jgi:UPF0176 protein
MILVLAYYYLGKIEDPVAEVACHKAFFEGKNARGRIYISEQGINGQASCGEEEYEAFRSWMARFDSVKIKIHTASEHPFPKMTVKYRKQLVAIDCDVDLSARGESVAPHQWKEMLQQRDENTLLVDVRNGYEWKVGHFEGAELPPLETFRQFPSYADELKKTRDPKTTRVMMYCTGGIRCEFFSAVMKQAGFEHVYQLDGGVIGYGLEEGGDHWKGKLFVFDDRLVVPISSDQSETIAECVYCKGVCDVYYNCANVDCNELFVACASCICEHKGCCGASCKSAPRVRPYQISAKPFRKMAADLFT